MSFRRGVNGRLLNVGAAMLADLVSGQDGRSVAMVLSIVNRLVAKRTILGVFGVVDMDRLLAIRADDLRLEGMCLLARRLGRSNSCILLTRLEGNRVCRGSMVVRLGSYIEYQIS